MHTSSATCFGPPATTKPEDGLEVSALRLVRNEITSKILSRPTHQVHPHEGRPRVARVIFIKARVAVALACLAAGWGIGVDPEPLCEPSAKRTVKFRFSHAILRSTSRARSSIGRATDS